MKKRREYKAFFYLFLRYLLLIFFASGNFWLLYSIFTPLTAYSAFFLLSLFLKTSLSGNILSINGFEIKLIEACIAGSAYYLLLILNLSTPIKLKKRIFSMLFSLSLFLLINILRIFSFSLLFVSSFPIFNLTHLIFWYSLSGIIVFLVWLFTIKLFHITKIPIYTDLKFLYKTVKIKPNSSQSC